MPQNLTRRPQLDDGFTLNEILAAILMIGVLAAIALPTILGQSARGQDAAAKSDARRAVARVESCFADAETYVGCDSGGPGNPAVITGQTAKSYVVTVASKSGNLFNVTRHPDRTYTRSCVANTAGAGCPTTLRW